MAKQFEFLSAKFNIKGASVEWEPLVKNKGWKYKIIVFYNGSKFSWNASHHPNIDQAKRFARYAKSEFDSLQAEAAQGN